MSQLEVEPEPCSSQIQQPSRLESCRPVALEYDPAGHGAQTEDDVAPAIASVQ